MTGFCSSPICFSSSSSRWQLISKTSLALNHVPGIHYALHPFPPISTLTVQREICVTRSMSSDGDLPSKYVFWGDSFGVVPNFAKIIWRGSSAFTSTTPELRSKCDYHTFSWMGPLLLKRKRTHTSPKAPPSRQIVAHFLCSLFLSCILVHYSFCYTCGGKWYISSVNRFRTPTRFSGLSFLCSWY